MNISQDLKEDVARGLAAKAADFEASGGELYVNPTP